MPRANSIKWSAVVPLEVAMVCSTPRYLAMLRSNLSMYSPLEDIHVDFKQSSTYFSSLPIRLGSATGMFLTVSTVSIHPYVKIIWHPKLLGSLIRYLFWLYFQLPIPWTMGLFLYRVGVLQCLLCEWSALLLFS